MSPYLQYELAVSLDNGSTIDIRLVTNQGKSTTNPHDADGFFDYRRLDTPSPSTSSHSSEDGNTPAGTGNVITDEHGYSCNPEMKDEMKILENELTAKIIFQNYLSGHSLRRFYPDDPNLGWHFLAAFSKYRFLNCWFTFRKPPAGAAESTPGRL